MARVKVKGEQLTLLELDDTEFVSHPVVREDFSRSRYLEKILSILCDTKPGNYQQLLATSGVGAKTVRALALVAEVIYGARPSYEDPARYSFAHGGKDGTPYEVDKVTYDKTIATLSEAVRRIKVKTADKDKALKRLNASFDRSTFYTK
jgi:hypothetical protein